jgi:hypothetical protein
MYRALPDGDGGQPSAPPSRPAFRVKAVTKTIHLNGDYAGAEVTVRRNVPMATILRLDKLKGDGELEQLIEILPEIVVRWNLEAEDGTPLPVTGQGFKSLPVDIFAAIMEAFNAVVTEGSAVSPN